MKITLQQNQTFIYTGGKALQAQRPTIVFIHGAQQDHSCWALQSRWFAYHGFNVLAPDLPVHGSSQGEPLTSIQAMSAWLVSLLDELAIPAAHLVGHSMGSLIALETALHDAQRVTSLGLIGTSLPMPVSNALLDAAKDNEPLAASLINQWSYSARAQLGGSAVPGLWLLGMNQQLMQRQQQGVFAVDLQACNHYQRDLNDLAQLTLPVLLLAGNQDKMTSPKVLGALEKAIPKAQLVLLKGAGHALMAEQPDAVLDQLRHFIQ